MPKPPWKSIDNHIDPEKEEQLKWIKIEVETQVKRVIKLTKSINHGNKEKNAKNKSEAISIVEDFQKQYGALYSLYDDLREQVKKNIKASRGDVDNNSSSSACNSDSESFHSLGGSNTGRAPVRSNSSAKDPDSSTSSDSHEPADQTSDLEDTILKDKLTSSSEVKEVTNLVSSHSESSETLKDLRVPEEESENIINQKTARIKYLEAHVQRLKLKVSTLCMEKGELKQQTERKSVEAMQMKDKILRLKAHVSETEAKLKENERRFYSVQQFEDSEKKYMSRISELMAQANSMQRELDTLRSQKAELEGRYFTETERSSSQVKGLMEHVNSLKDDLADANRQKAELKSELEKESEEKSACVILIENLRKELSLNQQLLTEEREGLKTQVHGLESKIRSLISTQGELEMQLNKSNHEASQSHGIITELQKSLSGKENELSMERRKFVDFQTLMSTKTKSQAEDVKNLKSDLELVESEKGHFKRVIENLKTDKNRLQMDLSKEKEESSISKSLVEKISKSNFQAVEKKVEEMLAEYRKQLDDKYRILSRRIRVAEQLHVENKEWYRKTKEAYEQQNKDLKIRAERNEIELKNIKDLTLAANDVLTSLDSVTLNFKECSANFLNRISKASCELKFAKHWAMRKNKAALHVKDELDCLLAQLDDKEAEILVFREKVWKSENKVRELEKTVKEKEDGMLGLMEEKREAIRQLCVWIDYHRGRSEFYMKMLSEMNPVRKRAS